MSPSSSAETGGGTRWGAPLAAESTLRKEFERNGCKRARIPLARSVVPGARPHPVSAEGDGSKRFAHSDDSIVRAQCFERVAAVSADAIQARVFDVADPRRDYPIS